MQSYCNQKAAAIPKIGIYIASSIVLGSRGIRSVGMTIKQAREYG